MLTLAKIFLVALLCSLLLTPWIRRLALRWGIVDHPDDLRKLHGTAMPLAGGVAVFGAFCAALAITYFWSPHWRERLADDWIARRALIASTLPSACWACWTTVSTCEAVRNCLVRSWWLPF
jgi:UDP-N-acetylmuramyl pentapeptide phosphotransferase/UDP-N-acetylglucosamine-1-phosphate transferase